MNGRQLTREVQTQQRVRIVAFSGHEAVVELAENLRTTTVFFLLEHPAASRHKSGMHQRKISLRRLTLAALVLGGTLVAASAADNPFVGRWALTIPGGGAGWLGVTQENGYLDASLLWGGGSVVPLDSAVIDNNTLMVTRVREVKRKDAAGKTIRTQRFTDLITAQADGDELRLNIFHPRDNGDGVERQEFDGKRIPPLPAAPDLAKVKFGPEVSLFNGKELTGWKLTDPGAVSGWSVQDGVLINRPVQEEGKPHKNYGNLRTEREFEDFKLNVEFRVPKDGNSGIYLRGIYEVQVADTFGKPLDSHNLGGIYSRITPSQAAEKPAGEWQTYEISLVDRHVTVILNGKKIIDNQGLLGCTGGALWSDELRPGPIYLQGDHTGVDYRKVTIQPVVK